MFFVNEMLIDVKNYPAMGTLKTGSFNTLITGQHKKVKSNFNLCSG